MTSVPDVYFRSGAGITTLSDMGDSFHDPFKGIDFRVDDFRSCQTDRVRSFQSISRDGDHSDAAAVDIAAFDQLLRDGNGDAARGFRENTFRFGQEADAGRYFRIRRVIAPAAGLEYESCRVVAVSRVADGERLRDRVRFDGANPGASSAHGFDDGVAAGSLRAEEARRERSSQQSNALQFGETFVDF